MIQRVELVIYSIVLALLVFFGGGGPLAMADQTAHKAAKKGLRSSISTHGERKMVRAGSQKKPVKPQTVATKQRQAQKAAELQGAQLGRIRAQTQHIAELQMQQQRILAQSNELRQQLQQSQAKNNQLADEIVVQRKKAATNVYVTIAGMLLLIGSPLLLGRALKGRMAMLTSRKFRAKPQKKAHASPDPFDAVTEPSFDDKPFLADLQIDDGLSPDGLKHTW